MRKLKFLTVLTLCFLSLWAFGQNGTADGTYHFGNLGLDDSGGAGFKKQGDKFAISNVAVNIGTEMYYSAKDATGNLVIKAEGGTVCKRFTLRNMAIYTYYSGSKQPLPYTKFEITLKNESGGVIATHQISSTVQIGETTISAIPFTTPWPVAGYTNVARIELSYAAQGLGATADVLTFKTLSIANVVGGTLPVRFGAISAKISSGSLQVGWTTHSEVNNDKFVVQVSKNGAKWTDVGTVVSKAEGGNSASTLNYSFGMPWGEMTLAGLGLLSLLLLPATRNRWMKFGVVVLALTVIVSCAKETENLPDRNIAATAKGATYVRVAQVDKNGTTTFSEVVVVKD